MQVISGKFLVRYMYNSIVQVNILISFIYQYLGLQLGRSTCTNELQGFGNMVCQKDSPVSFNFLQVYVIAILINLRLPLVICVWGKLLISEIFHTDTLRITNVKEVLNTEIG